MFQLQLAAVERQSHLAGPDKGKLEKEAYIPTSRVDDIKRGRFDC